MESDSSANNFLSLFNQSNLIAYEPATSRSFYQPQALPSMSAENSPDQTSHTTTQPPQLTRRRSQTAESRWSCKEIQQLHLFKDSIKNNKGNERHRTDMMFPNRSIKSIHGMILKIEMTINERETSKKRKLEQLKEEEEAEFAEREMARFEERQRRMEGLDTVLGLGDTSGELESVPETEDDVQLSDQPSGSPEPSVKLEFDDELGFAEEDAAEDAAEIDAKRKNLDEVLGLGSWS